MRPQIGNPSEPDGKENVAVQFTLAVGWALLISGDFRGRGLVKYL
jgi:hypothetical protein